MNKFKSVILILILTLISCQDNRERRKGIVSEKMEAFSAERLEWEELTQRILKNEIVNANLGKSIEPSELGKSLETELEEKGISRISVLNSSECKEVEYITNWTGYPIGTLYLTWTTCGNKQQTEKGYYEDNFDSNFIEIWGIGNNWLIWTDSDFI